MRIPVQLAVYYTVFALIATGSNLLAQESVVQLYDGPFAIPGAMLFGTGVGLVVKYWLDKTYIFQYHAQSLEQDARVFILYASMGVFTTVIFWGSEFAFHHLFETKTMRYVGACIGLSMGYVLKYNLDKHFVFKRSYDDSNPILGETLRA